MSTIERRVSELEAARERQQRKAGVVDDVEQVRLFLESMDGQAALDMRHGEDIFTVCVRRLQVAEGWNLDLMPGATLTEKETNVEKAHYGKITVSAEARHAARGWFQLWGFDPCPLLGIKFSTSKRSLPRARGLTGVMEPPPRGSSSLP